MDSEIVKSANEWEIYVYIRKDINITGYDDIEGEREGERKKIFSALKSVQNATF